MAIATIPLTSFTGGEWSNRLHGRTDIAKYQSACEVLQNFVLYPHGGITRRMGMELIEEAKTDSVRLIPFEYNREQAYVLEFGENYIRFFRNGAQLLDGSSLPYEIATTYTEDELSEISFAQSADVLYIAHPNHKPRKLERPGPDTFTIGDVTFTGMPAEWVATDWPRAVTFYSRRLVFGGIKSKPMTLWFSKQDDYEVFTTGVGATDAMTFTLSSHQVNAIQWLMPAKRLLVGTTGGEFSVYGPSGSLTPTSIQVDRESNFGSKSGRVQLVGNEVLYTSRDGKKLRAMGYAYESDGYVSPELSILSEHLTRSGVKEFDFAQNPDGILWSVLQDGGLAGFTYLKSQEVQGWHSHVTDGEVLSVCTIEGDSSSEVWLAVNRGAGGTMIERMAVPFEGEDPNDIGCAYLDSYISLDSETPVTTLSGLNHLEGKTVGVMGDGSDLGNFVVTSGGITLPESISKAVVGLRYQWRVVPLKLEGGSTLGFSQGKKKRIISITARVERTAGINHKLYKGQTNFELPIRSYGENYDSSIPLYTGDIEIEPPAGWGTDGQFELFGDSVFPVTILMISAMVMVNE